MLPIRLIIPTLPVIIQTNGKPKITHTDVGYSYLSNLLKAGFKVRAIPSGGMAYGFLANDDRWGRLKAAFFDDCVHDNNFINVVIGHGPDWNKFWTANVPNIAVTVAWPRLPNTNEIIALEKFTVLAPFQTDVDTLAQGGITAQLVYPDVENLTTFFTPLCKI